MQDSTRRSLDPRFGVNEPRPGSDCTQPAKSFCFAVTWTSVTAHLNLLEASDWTPAQAKSAVIVTTNQASLAAAAAVSVLPAPQRPAARSESAARWEMVVPKMDRGARAPAKLPKAAPYPEVYPPVSIPALTGLPAAPTPTYLGKALAFVGLATGRANHLQALQLNGPSAPTPAPDLQSGRELLLSKITKSLRSRAHGWPRTAIQDDAGESSPL